MSARITWLLESEVLDDLHERLVASAKAFGHSVKTWQNTDLDHPGRLDSSYVIFHGSLEVAAKIAERMLWWPGAFCNVGRFHCSEWYPSAKPWLLHRHWVLSTVERFVSSPDAVLEQLGARESVFVRPDSPLKPFSGRVLQRDNISLRSLDHGFYYEDLSLPIIIAPIRQIGQEWRFVVVNRSVASGSEYVANGRSSANHPIPDLVKALADRVAAELDPPESVYILDIAESEGELGVIELNPFSGADLYACGTDEVVLSIDKFFAEEHRESIEQLQQGLADIDAGRYVPAREVIEEARRAIADRRNEG